MGKRILFPTLLLIILGLLVTGCYALAASTNKPIVVITSPPSNSQFRAGEPVTVQSTATDPVGIVSVELAVDGVVIRTDPSPKPQASFTVIQTWPATPGTHVVTVRAINTANVVSDPAGIEILVLSSAATPTPTPRGCVNAAVFVADLTLPDGTLLAPGQTANKIWRVRNTGNCTWGAGDELVFIGGEAMTATTAIAVPATAPGNTADLLVALTAPTTSGNHLGLWRLKSKSGIFFGATLNVLINVIGTPPPPSCPFTPVIESFTVSPTTIVAGQSATLSWGFVKGAERADIDNDIGGVPTPGSTTVSPATTTTYTLTATCGSKVTTAQVTLTVVSPTAVPTATPTKTHTGTPTP